MVTTAERLKAAHLRVTTARVSILELLEAQAVPMAHTEILSRVPDLDRVTLYRVLDALVEADLVHRVQGIDAVWRFCAHANDVTGCPGGHPHFMCERCGAMVCLTDQVLPHVDTPRGSVVSHKQMLLVGICETCQKA